MPRVGSLVDICVDCLVPDALYGCATHHEDSLLETDAYLALTDVLNDSNALDWYAIHHTKFTIEDICDSLVD